MIKFTKPGAPTLAILFTIGWESLDQDFQQVEGISRPLAHMCSLTLTLTQWIDVIKAIWHEGRYIVKQTAI